MRLHDDVRRLRWPLASTDTHLRSQTHDRKLDDIALDKTVEYGDGDLDEIVTEKPAKTAFKVVLPQADGNTASGPAHP